MDALSIKIAWILLGLDMPLPKEENYYILTTSDKTHFGEEITTLNGKIHNISGPAILSPRGSRHYFINNKRHRENGPAVVYPDGGKEWCYWNKLHRIDGPAVISCCGRQEWWVDNERHRENGPAVVYPDGSKEWWIRGIQYLEDGTQIKVPKTKKISVEPYFQSLLDCYLIDGRINKNRKEEYYGEGVILHEEYN